MSPCQLNKASARLTSAGSLIALLYCGHELRPQLIAMTVVAVVFGVIVAESR